MCTFLNASSNWSLPFFFSCGDQILKANYSPHVVFWCVHFGVFNVVFRKYFFSLAFQQYGAIQPFLPYHEKGQLFLSLLWCEVLLIRIRFTASTRKHSGWSTPWFQKLNFLPYCCSDILISWFLPHISRCPLKLHLLCYMSARRKVWWGGEECDTALTFEDPAEWLHLCLGATIQSLGT